MDKLTKNYQKIEVPLYRCFAAMVDKAKLNVNLEEAKTKPGPL